MTYPCTTDHAGEETSDIQYCYLRFSITIVPVNLVYIWPLQPVRESCQEVDSKELALQCMEWLTFIMFHYCLCF